MDGNPHIQLDLYTQFLLHTHPDLHAIFNLYPQQHAHNHPNTFLNFLAHPNTHIHIHPLAHHRFSQGYRKQDTRRLYVGSIN